MDWFYLGLLFFLLKVRQRILHICLFPVIFEPFSKDMQSQPEGLQEGEYCVTRDPYFQYL